MASRSYRGLSATTIPLPSPSAPQITFAPEEIPPMATPTIPTIPATASLETVWHRAVYSEQRLLRNKLTADLAPPKCQGGDKHSDQ